MARVPGFIPNLTIHSRRRRPWRSLTGMADVIAGKVNADVLTGLIIRTSLPDLTAHYCSNPGSTAQSSWEGRSEEHTSELQSLMRISYAVFCWKHKKLTKQ